MVVTVQALRRSRGLSLIDLARLSGVPARTIGAIELGTLRLDGGTRRQLAYVFAVAPAALHHSPPPPLLATIRPAFDPRQAALPFATALATTALAAALLPRPFSNAPLTEAPLVAAAPPAPAVVQLREPALALAENLIKVEAVNAILVRQVMAAPSLAAQTRSPAVNPAPVALIDAKHADAARPRGCPLVVDSGAVVVTQGYAEGTHAPAAIWGALDFGVDGDGDGVAEPDATRGAPVIATHSGIARVFPGSWPGGNFIRLEDRDNGWNTAYGHLDLLLVADGQEVRRGAQIGTVGSTGQSTGPHLHYEVWRNGVNVDPSPYVACTQ